MTFRCLLIISLIFFANTACIRTNQPGYVAGYATYQPARSPYYDVYMAPYAAPPVYQPHVLPGSSWGYGYRTTYGYRYVHQGPVYMAPAYPPRYLQNGYGHGPVYGAPHPYHNDGGHAPAYAHPHYGGSHGYGHGAHGHGHR